MPPRAYPFRKGARVRGTVYDYAPGDVLDIHTHDEPNNHCTIITNGFLEVLGDNEHVGRTVGQGEVIDFEPGRPHGFRALTAARMINLLLNSNTDLAADANV